MNREIKFRAWDKKEKKMLYNIEYHNGEFFSTFEETQKPAHCLIEVMQYTGLKDKNEKKIYEGDILENGYEVICGNQFGGIVIKRTFKKGKKTEEVILHEIKEQKELNVIGDIYENKELLK